MDERPIIVITGNGLFDMGVSLGFGAVIGALLALFLYLSAERLMGKVTGIFKKSK